MEIFTGLFFFLLSNNRNTAWDSTFQHFCVDNDRIGIHTVLTFYANFTIFVSLYSRIPIKCTATMVDICSRYFVFVEENRKLMGENILGLLYDVFHGQPSLTFALICYNWSQNAELCRIKHIVRILKNRYWRLHYCWFLMISF